MDMLSSQSTVSGYKAVLMGAAALPKFLPSLTTAAGSIPPARAFVLGDAAKDGPDAFGRIAEWFARAALAHRAELEAVAREHHEVELTGAGVLDRLLWFDSEGHQHFPKIDVV